MVFGQRSAILYFYQLMATNALSQLAKPGKRHGSSLNFGTEFSGAGIFRLVSLKGDFNPAHYSFSRTIVIIFYLSLNTIMIGFQKTEINESSPVQAPTSFPAVSPCISINLAQNSSG